MMDGTLMDDPVVRVWVITFLVAVMIILYVCTGAFVFWYRFIKKEAAQFPMDEWSYDLRMLMVTACFVGWPWMVGFRIVSLAGHSVRKVIRRLQNG